jgi:Domain of unknown function (DUF4350)
LIQYLPYRLFVILSVTFFISCTDKSAIQLPDMTHSYSKRSKKPFGSYASYKMLEEKYKEEEISVLNNSFYNNWIAKLGGKKGLYVIIAKNVLLSEKDLNAMLDYVNNGNHLFIAAEYIDESLTDTLGMQVQSYSMKSLFQNQLGMIPPLRNTTVALKDSVQFGSNRYGYFYFPFDASFIKSDSIGAKTLGLNDNNEPNYISFVYGKGRFFFHLNPETFSNYFVLKNNNKEYVEKILSYTSADRTVIYWDDYYRLGLTPTDNFSSFAVFLKYPMLRWTLILAMALMLFYISFGSKRKQRPQPVLQQNNNDSISFVETIGRLYLQKKDNHNIAAKMITYFMEYIRSHYYLNTSQLNAEFFSSLSRKSAVNEEQVRNIFQSITQLQETTSISDEQLLDLNNQIQFFLKK